MFGENNKINNIIMSEIYDRVKDANINLFDLYQYLMKREQEDIKEEK